MDSGTQLLSVQRTAGLRRDVPPTPDSLLMAVATGGWPQGRNRVYSGLGLLAETVKFLAETHVHLKLKPALTRFQSSVSPGSFCAHANEWQLLASLVGKTFASTPF
ncbi:UNVERIFIED_CONTAM: hypothetical protein K2H54_075161 [Gekko kuhli]